MHPVWELLWFLEQSKRQSRRCCLPPLLSSLPRVFLLHGPRSGSSMLVTSIGLLLLFFSECKATQELMLEEHEVAQHSWIQ